MRLFGREINLPKFEKRGTFSSPFGFREFLNRISNGISKSGVKVNSWTALTFAAVFRAVAIYRQVMMILPGGMYQKKDDGRIRIDHPVEDLFNGMANPEMTSEIFKETMQAWLTLKGVAFAEIVHDEKYYPVALWPIDPDLITVQRNHKSNEIEYKIIKTGTIIPWWKMFHLKGYSYNGINCYSPIKLAKDSIGLGLASEEFGNRYFKEGTNLGGFVKHPKTLGDDAFKRLKAEMDQKYKGLKKSHGVIILEEGMEYSPLQINLEDSQFLQTRKFQITEIARWFNLPPHMLYDLERSTFSNIEHQGMEAVRDSFLPTVVRWESEINTKLLLVSEWKKEKKYYKFNMDSLLRGDLKSRMESYNIACQNGIMNRDECRAKEDMKPIKGGAGQVHTVQLNMCDITQLSQINANNQKKELKSNNITPEKRDSNQDIEERARKTKRKISEKYEARIKKAVEKILKEERSFVENGLNEVNYNDFTIWLQDNYDEFRSIVEKLIRPVLTSYALELHPAITTELNSDKEVNESYEKFIEDYIRGFATRYSISSKKQLISVRNEDESTSEDIVGRLDEWEETRPDKVSSEEKTRGRNAFTKTLMAAIGVSYIKVRANGKSCPICSSLNGKIVGISEPVLPKGQEYKSGSMEQSLTPKTNLFHAPFHKGCDCDMVVES